MKYIVLVADGMADMALGALRGRTPLEVARCPAMDEVVRRGRTGRVWTVPKGFEAGSDVGNLSLLGYDPAQYFTGRGPLEAAGRGLKLEAGEAVFRCNFVTFSNDRLADYCAGQLTTHEAGVLVDALQKGLGNERIRFYPGVGYRHFLVVRNLNRKALTRLECIPPHEIVGERVRPNLPRGPESRLLNSLMRSARELLSAHEINQVRVDLGENPANAIWPWSGGITPALENFEARFGTNGFVISAVDLVCGIGALAGLTKIDVPGATGYVNTDYQGKGRAFLSALNTRDFVYVHVEAPDGASHSGNLRQKIQAIESFDRWIVDPALRYLDEHSEARLLVGTAHMAAVETRTNRAQPVPFAVCGRNISTGEASVFGEAEAAKSPLRFSKGHKLMPWFIKEKKA